MSRPGGAWGAGCGVVGLLGLLLGVGLTVWLGSRAFDATTGDDGPTDAARDIASASTITVPGDAAGSPGSIVLAPADGLADGTSVAIEGAGLPPGEARATVCLTFQTRAAGALAACDETTTTTLEVAPDGRAIGRIVVPREIRVLTDAYDCAAFAGACSVLLHQGDSLGGAAEAPLSFAGDLPPSDATTPPRG